MNAITKGLDGLEIGEPIVSGAAFLFPLLNDGMAAEPPLTFDQALELGLLKVDELSLAGHVPEIVVENQAERPVFLLDGEQVLGLKQNRTFNLSMLVPPKTRTIVPVSCLEMGRWSARHQPVRAAEHVHFASGRANKLRSVSASLRSEGSYASDQRLVWDDIGRRLHEAEEFSDTSAEADYVAGRRTSVESLRMAFVAFPRQVGAVVGVGDRILGVDLFLEADADDLGAGKLLKSYLLEAIAASSPAAPPSRGELGTRLRALFSGSPECFPSPGCGEALRWTSRHGSAAALIRDGECVHAVGFFASSSGDLDAQRVVA